MEGLHRRHRFRIIRMRLLGPRACGAGKAVAAAPSVVDRAPAQTHPGTTTTITTFSRPSQGRSCRRTRTPLSPLRRRIAGSLGVSGAASPTPRRRQSTTAGVRQARPTGATTRQAPPPQRRRGRLYGAEEITRAMQTAAVGSSPPQQEEEEDGEALTSRTLGTSPIRLKALSGTTATDE